MTMQSGYQTPQNLLASGVENHVDFEQLIYGTNDVVKQLNDTFRNALNRYMSDSGIGTKKLSKLTGIAPSTITRYCNDTGRLTADHLYAICIALKLKPCQQRHLLVLAELVMPDERGGGKKRAFIIRDHLDGCSFDERFTVASCNQQLRIIQCPPLTTL